jgi:hypothetical protein
MILLGALIGCFAYFYRGIITKNILAKLMSSTSPLDCLLFSTYLPLEQFPQAKKGLRNNITVEAVERATNGFKFIAFPDEPFFIKRVVEAGTAASIAWELNRIYMFTGGEYVSEFWRRFIFLIVC